ncbi:hypothetical protein TNCV_3224211 [Trichonephila clavipes]|nr:hypothetical protein TNCV_3224211 [Trichonephila clavipes]
MPAMLRYLYHWATAALRRFGINAEKQAVKLFFHMQSPEFFLEGSLKLIKFYDKCLNVLGTYAENKFMPYL